ncbi:MAG: hypothetical protein U0800_27405 [Isosphaeraceae bacterium]
MSSAQIDPNLVIPKPQTARVFGMLHLLYGVVLCFLTYTAAMMFLFAPVGTDLLKAWMGGIGDTVARERSIQARRIERLKELATSDEQRATYDQRLANLQTAPAPNFRDLPMGTEALEDPTIRGYSFVDLIGNMPLNLLMIAGGIGLVRLREWGRKLSWWASALKVGAMAISTVYLLVVIYPIQSKMVMQQLEAQQKFQASLMRGAAPPVFPFGSQSNSLIAASATLSSLFWIGIGAAYPITSLVVLQRRSIRAACWRRPEAEDGPAPEGGMTP